LKNPKKNLPFFTLFIIYFIIKENKRKNGSEMTYKNKDTEAKEKKKKTEMERGLEKMMNSRNLTREIKVKYQK
jgi:hypothetical protein